MKQYHIFISGLVQKVGYRNFCQRKARELGLSGWVRNLVDGRVEIMTVGNDEDLKTFVAFLRRGPFLARVERVEVEEIFPVDTNLRSKFVRRSTV